MSNDQLSPHKGANYQLDRPIVSRRGGVLRAEDFDDLYFDAQDGLAEHASVASFARCRSCANCAGVV